jgi:hypothetical protein
MRIDEAKNAFKVADIILEPDKTKKNYIKIKFIPEITNELGEKLPLNFLGKKIGHVYLFVVDGEIKKIGGSGDGGGIKRSLGAYESSMGGSPSSNRFGMQLILKEALKSGSKIEVYVITSNSVSGKVKGFFSEEDMNICYFKETEDKCRKDYKDKMGECPPWNYQERHEQFPQQIREKYAQYKMWHARKDIKKK